MEAQGLLPTVLQHLRSPADIVVCSAECKPWRVACRAVQPLNIVIGQSSDGPGRISVAGLTGVLQRLQVQHAQQRLQQLLTLEVHLGSGFIPECHKKHHLLAFCQSVLPIAGCCRLTGCRLTGKLCVESAASLLPVTLQELCLGVHGDQPDAIPLSWFARLVNLKWLELGVIRTDHHSLSAANWVLCDAKLESLQTLIVLYTPFRIADNCSFAACLPRLHSVWVRIGASQAQDILVHSSLRLADLRFYQDLDAQPAVVLHMFAEACGQLKTLSVKADELLEVMMNIDVPNIEFVCCDCVKVRYRLASSLSFAPLRCGFSNQKNDGFDT